MTAWVVPGYDELELLGFGRSGELWRARERGTGELVALRRLTGTDPEAITAVRRAATVVRTLASPHLVRLRTTTRAGGDDVLVLDHASGGSLAALLARRGSLEPGEVVTALAPVAEALGQAHAHGIVHGHLDGAAVLLSADGRPLLDGLGMDVLRDPDDGLDPAGARGPADDVRRLGAVGHELLTGRPPHGPDARPLGPTVPVALARALGQAMDPVPGRRPAAGDLAAALLASCQAAPLSGVHPAPAEPASRKRHPGLARHPGPARLPAGWRLRLPGRRPTGAVVALVAAASSVVLAVVLAGWAWGGADAPRAAQVPVVSQQPDWAGVLSELDAARGQAFALGRPELLETVYAPGSPLLAADRSVLAALRRSHRTADGLRHDVQRVRVQSADTRRAVLQVTEELAGYDLLDPTGAVAVHRPAGGVVTHVLVLVREPDGWRLAQAVRREI